MLEHVPQRHRVVEGIVEKGKGGEVGGERANIRFAQIGPVSQSFGILLRDHGATAQGHRDLRVGVQLCAIEHQRFGIGEIHRLCDYYAVDAR